MMQLLRPGLPSPKAVVMVCFLPVVLFAAAAEPDSTWRNQAPKLYVQDETYCDLDYVKTEICFVNYVRERTEADIHVTITYQATAAGGREYNLAFAGRGGSADLNFALKHTTSADATTDDIRQALVAALKRGLVPFLARTPLSDRLSVEFSPPTTAARVTDPWHNWVCSISLNGYATGDNEYIYAFYNLYPEVKRVTETEKLEFDAGVSDNRRRYVMDSTIINLLSRSYYADAGYGRKLTEHWSAGAQLNYLTSDYSNIRMGLSAGPRAEYNLVPYSEYVRHKVYARWEPLVVYRSYFDSTLYNRMAETRVKNALTLGTTLTRRWGTVDLSATGSHYLHDFTKNRLSLDASVSLRVVAGLSVQLYGGYSFIHDQLSLRKEGASEEERLLRLREMATGYSYWASLGVSYTFGSIYSNIVNPIF